MSSSEGKPSREDTRPVKVQRKAEVSKHEFYMGMAILAAKRSKDPKTQVGAVIVDSMQRIVGVGWNGMPLGVADEEEIWDPDSKHDYVVHAELNAIMFKTVTDIRGSTMYVTLCPCKECAKAILQSGIETIYYLSDKKQHKPEFKAARDAFKKANLGRVKEIKLIDFLKEYGDIREKKTITLNFLYMQEDNPSSEEGAQCASTSKKRKLEDK